MDKFQWWTELTHGGIFISNPVLNESFEEKQIETWHWKYKRLRDNYNSFLSKESVYKRGSHPVHAWITHLFEDFLGHDSNHWLKGQNIPQRFSILSKTGMLIKPRRVLTDDIGEAILLLQRDDSQRLGMHKGRRSYAQFVDLLRKSNVSLGILINGHQIRLVYAGLDHDAWVQFQVDAWFDEGETRHQLNGFLTLLHPDNLKVEDESFPLLDAVNTSRTRQADLADVLGNQIRQAVELLTSAIGRVQQSDMKFLDTVQITPGTQSILSEAESLSAVYQAATRMVMRKVILFYAEAKELLPKDNPFYFDNYSIEGLFSQLMGAVQHSGGEELKTRYSAWQRFLALSNMVHNGSEHEILPLKAYGGVLFRRGDKQSADVVLRALSLFEQPNISITDYEVYQILRRIKIGKTKVRQGRGSTDVSGPVDFGDMRTEYIGMMYEGLLDYELKKVENNDPKVIMSIGDQPILPLKLLEPMDDTAIKNLFKTMKAEIDSTTSVEETSLFNKGEEEKSGEYLDDSTTYGRSLRWAVKAVEIARLVSRPRGAAAMQVYEEKKLEKARSLVLSVLEPGEMYLSRWGGTRKGSGTFYTKPSLALPTTWRTLEPLVYDIVGEEKKVKTPKDILNLRVCDPAVGSGTFLVASVRYLTEVLYESVLTHILTYRDSDGNVVITPSEQVPLTLDLQFEAPPIKPIDDGWEGQMKARLKRLIVERCLFGVDYNGMAVELARLALWLETMDKELPFEFLDHRIKQGNSLVGTWFSQYRNYPAKAWERQDGTGSDRNNKKILREVVKPQLATFITGAIQYSLLEEAEPQETTLNRQMKYWSELEETHLLDTGKREEIYRQKIEGDEDYKKLKHQFDRWCAIWFWPSENSNNPILSPNNFFSDDEKISDVVIELQSRHHFFHWELEFPEVFTKMATRDVTGFDVMIGNPPWDIQKPNSKEFFSHYDPIYRTYDRNYADHRRNELFQHSADIEKEWHTYNRYFKSMSNYVKNAHNPYKVGLSSTLTESWSFKRKSQLTQHAKTHPYRYQGSADINLYKLFLEQWNNLLNPKGRLGIIVPAGIISDKGTKELRELYFEQGQVELMYMFWNRKKIFNITFERFCVLIANKNNYPITTQVAFNKTELQNWESVKLDTNILNSDFLQKTSPLYKTIVQVESQLDVSIFSHVYKKSIFYKDFCDINNIRGFKGEYHLTNERHAFTALEDLELISNNPVSELLISNDTTYYPMYTGKLIYLCDFAAKKWLNGHGNGAVWKSLSFHQKEWCPEFVLPVDNAKHVWRGGIRLVMRDITNPVNERTVIVALIPAWPCSNKVPILVEEDELDLITTLKLFAVMSSFIFDYICRIRMVGVNLNKFILDELPIPDLNKIPDEIAVLVARYALPNKIFAKTWDELSIKFPQLLTKPWSEWFALNKSERSRLRAIVDACVARAYGFNKDTNTLISYILTPDSNRPKSFNKFDSDLPEFARLPQLVLRCLNESSDFSTKDLIDQKLLGNWSLPLDVKDVLMEDIKPQDYLDWGKCDELSASFYNEIIFQKEKR